MWINTYTLMIGLDGSAVKRAVRDGSGFAAPSPFGCKSVNISPQMRAAQRNGEQCGPGVFASSENLSRGQMEGTHGRLHGQRNAQGAGRRSQHAAALGPARASQADGHQI